MTTDEKDDIMSTLYFRTSNLGSHGTRHSAAHGFASYDIYEEADGAITIRIVSGGYELFEQALPIGVATVDFAKALVGKYVQNGLVGVLLERKAAEYYTTA